MKYLIWSNEHDAWWGPDGWGYTRTLAGAGRYSREDAIRICKQALPTAMHIGRIAEVPVLASDIADILADAEVPIEVVVDPRDR